jgi:DNA-directed RNA polymerase subunit F
MIKNQKAISMPEVLEYISGKSEGEEKTKIFIKKFIKLSTKDAKEMNEKLEKLDLMKIKPEDIIKIIDMLPQTEEELNKIFVGINLDENEMKNILDIVKEYK